MSLFFRDIAPFVDFFENWTWVGICWAPKFIFDYVGSMCIDNNMSLKKNIFGHPPPAYISYYRWCCIFVPQEAPRGSHCHFKNTKRDDATHTTTTHWVTKECLGGAIPPEYIIRCQKWRFFWKSLCLFRYKRVQKIIWQKINLEHFFFAEIWIS